MANEGNHRSIMFSQEMLRRASAALRDQLRDPELPLDTINVAMAVLRASFRQYRDLREFASLNHHQDEVA